MAKGIEKGLREGAFLVLLRLLEHRFGTLPEDVIQQLHLISVEQVERLVDVALIAPNIEEFSAHLPLRDTSSTNSV